MRPLPIRHVTLAPKTRIESPHCAKLRDTYSFPESHPLCGWKTLDDKRRAELKVSTGKAGGFRRIAIDASLGYRTVASDPKNLASGLQVYIVGRGTNTKECRMRSSMMFFEVRMSAAPTRRRSKSRSQGFGKMLSKLDTASNKLARSRPRR